ncbi:hypothetical protein SAMN02910340_00713 [Methanosarcina thermophila]|jgi:hypothetical protein|uniref:Uncharacterized protein n=4 Tax=Methanosarcina TaxID=2207 RepID=A0A1I6Y1F6_METTE|nr:MULTISPECIES: hypothetical protein [Methanosarcina]ALK05816.1 MAG: hypothetical protein AAY43_09060 [Methanosarcina sp. 795]AKB12707.1 hypothetical protein MSTHT_0949 [Methanosarcina thermophila TM-1]AKB16675.1 hypothetical protein MSTHC_2357 [Methanosarcina thermophila CHTI-55]AYK15772.1 hypothetical protein AOB57_011740 [Methanosarcina flavescens]NLK32811.1 hypothetical protein [Methanosarcina flavescens]
METKTKPLIAAFLAVLAIFLVFFLMIYQPGAGMYIRADKFQDPPERYIEFSLEDLEKYPCVKEAVMNPGKNIIVPSNYHENISEFGKISSNNGTNYIKVNNEYYDMHYESAD